MATKASGNPLQLTLATGAFAICFAVFGSVSALMPLLKKSLGLNAFQVSLAIAVPVLLGSLGRIPLGMLTDRYGGRLIFSLVMLCSIVPAFLMGLVSDYTQLILCGFFIGIALAVFSVGVSFVSGWYPPEQQGYALGLYGIGTGGQSLAAMFAPIIASGLGVRWGFWTFGILLIIWLGLFWWKAENAPRRAPVKSLKEMLAPMRERMSWVLSLYYFLTFGGFVAMGIYLPIFLTDLFKLTPQDAGLRTAGFVALAVAVRPYGGKLADLIGGRKVLIWVFPLTMVMACLMMIPQIVPFTIGALAMATAIGIGNGAVFKLVPEYFPQTVGAVTGLVGAAGGLGGFFPPLVLGVVKQSTGSFAPGFFLLALFAGACWLVVMREGGSATPHTPLGKLASSSD
ncbi:MAG: NarK/NasA family nitrate transporter [Acidobacteria bacterium]|nr:NarK/NasA family nitrate transporter [Acidobacteriota bacterium]